MSAVRAELTLPGAAIGEAEALWYDLGRRPAFVDGFGALARREGDWPRAGARIVWDSRRGGRGRVVERVLEHEPGAGQRTAVEDPAISGEQSVRFAAAPGGCAIALELRYALKRGGPVRALTDLLFVRRAQTDALRRTLERFAVELAAERELTAPTVRPRPLHRDEKEI